MTLIVKHAYDLILDDVFLQVGGVGGLRQFYLKIESFNPAGSVKMKTARGLDKLLPARPSFVARGRGAR